MSAALRARLIGSRPLLEAQKQTALEAGLELSAVLSGVGADILAAAGRLAALYEHGIPPDRSVALAELALNRARAALRAFDDAMMGEPS